MTIIVITILLTLGTYYYETRRRDPDSLPGTDVKAAPYSGRERPW